MTKPRVTCTETSVIHDAKTRGRLWDIYRSAFAEAETDCIQQQLCYDRQTFDEALTDPVYRKFVVDVDGDPVGYILCTLDLERARVTYMNPVRLQAAYPQYAGRICYFSAIAMDPTHQKTLATRVLMQKAGDAMDREGLIVAFDYSTEKNPDLPKLLVAVLRDTRKKHGWISKEIEYRPLGGQEYGVIEFIRE